ncbi:uncharacterized protein BO72DRAFT_232289 [Aspergillus fijiensis CBS 313.89]|uniref:HAD-like protein n=1 Tax=Aspergillus fijiensis CBS 313.89 TaxID=1448319 RepID=A0A8G1VVU8_9EURO|nr:uncharacterized protein BO72DRAFT_232289 [Aspergillus fijiensis CBS 313.89]RAK73578.1 hypothetical protein BO72DRAFT_232289 [Aspergillus fijiensis CBS 313.89]
MNRPILRACYRSSFTSGAYPATQTLFSTPRFLTPLRAVLIPRNHRQLPQSRRTMTTTNNHQSASAPRDPRPIFFFDIDNCLYSRECNIHDEMQKLISELHP